MIDFACRVVAVLLLIALLAMVLADVSKAATPAQASFRVRAPAGGGAAYYGSATAIGKKCVVTNSHVVEHHHRDDLTVISPTGQKYRGQTIVVNQGADLALIWCKDADLPYVEIASADPQPGEEVLKMGYGGEGQLMKAAGVCQGIDGYIGNRCPVVATTCETVSGDSGGGNFNAAGELVSVTWGSTDTNGGNGRSTPASVLRQVALEWQTQFCPQGNCPIVRPGRGQRPQTPRGGGRQPVDPNEFNPPTPGPPPEGYADQPDPVPPPKSAPVVPIQPPAQPIVQAPPVKGCECDSAKLGCKCDQSKAGCKCDEGKLHSSIAELKAELNAKLEALVLKQPEKGDPGPPGETPDAITIKQKIEQAIQSKLGVLVQNKTQGTGFLGIGICAAALVGAVVLLRK
jgi:S1-C subfamily serine protease